MKKIIDFERGNSTIVPYNCPNKKKYMIAFKFNIVSDWTSIEIPFTFKWRAFLSFK